MSPKLSTTMEDVLRRMAPTGKVIRLRGGFWTTPDCPILPRGTPQWFVGFQTIRSLEERGLVKYQVEEVWPAERVLTDAGRDAVKQLLDRPSAP